MRTNSPAKACDPGRCFAIDRTFDTHCAEYLTADGDGKHVQESTLPVRSIDNAFTKLERPFFARGRHQPAIVGGDADPYRNLTKRTSGGDRNQTLVLSFEPDKRHQAKIRP